ncbi:hypothetical protein F2Q69_00008114 [Brassica cretica]|uniref:Uncharacterized protein n=1 Tax=Brassica cretica TaxID=69181 RepID=A0A8S9PA48_BRACR|nr:hypothetical protein F2Q69_00008114 [Brassica cretica]
MGEPSTPRPMNSVAAGEGKNLGFSGCSIVRTTQDETIKRSDLDALIKALKENSGNILGTCLDSEGPRANFNRLMAVLPIPAAL